MRSIPWSKNAWKSRFFAIWGGQAFSLFGSQLVQFALVWWLTAETGSGMVLATASLVALIPGVALGPFIGALVDRWDRRRIMLVADAAVALATLALAALFAVDVIRLWHIYAALVVRSVGSAFHWPAMSVSTTLMVPKEHYSRIAGLNRSLGGAANMLSPLLGAALVSAVPMAAVLAVDVVTAAIAIVPLLLIRLPELPARSAHASRSLISDLREGLQFVLSWPGLRAVLGIATTLNALAGAAFSLLPLLIVTRFQGAAFHFAAVQTAEGAAVVVTGLVVAAWGGFKHRMRAAMIGMIFTGAWLLGLALVPSSMFPAAVALLFCIGATSTVTNASYSAALRASIPPDLLGRVFTLVNTAEEGLKPVALVAAGVLADRVGAGVWFAIDGATAIAIGVIALFAPAILQLEKHGAAIIARRAARLDEAASPP